MRKIEKLNLVKLSKEELDARQMNGLRGGTNEDSTCNCNCSSSAALDYTMGANSKYGYQYSYGGDGNYKGTCECICLGGTIMATTRGNAGN